MANNKRLRVVTDSELRTRRRCAREHHYAYELGLRSALEVAPALRFGTLIHIALEAWWKAPKAARLQRALEALPLETDPFDLARATEMLRGYDLRWRDQSLEALIIPGRRTLVEAEFRAALVNPVTGQVSELFELGGKLDVLALDHNDGRVWIVEHKTSGDDLTPGSDYWRALTLDTQISMYYVGARALGFEPAGVWYDVLGKPKLKPCLATPLDKRKYRAADGQLYSAQRDHDETAEEFQARLRDEIALNPDRYYARGAVVRFDDEEREAGWDTWHVVRGIQLDSIAQHWPRNPDRCRRFGGMCAYFGVCTKVASLDDATLFRKVERVHEELAADAPLEEASHVTH